MKVRDLMTTDPLTATPEMLLKEAARLMVRNKVSGLPVVSEGELVGIVTEGDFLRQEANRDQPYRFSLLDALLNALLNALLSDLFSDGHCQCPLFGG